MATQTYVNTAPGQQNGMTARPQDDDLTVWLDEFRALSADPNPTAHPVNKQPWNFSAWGFCNPFGICITTSFCPCITVGKTHHRLHHDARLEGYSTVNTTCLAYTCCMCFTGCHPAFNIAQRGTIKRRWGLQGSFIGDCLRAWCCTCCDIIQHEKEVKYRLLGEGGAPTMVTQQPQTMDQQMKIPAKGGSAV